MPDLLIRGLSEETKRRLAVQAAHNGRSQSAEACAILEEALSASPGYHNLGEFLLSLRGLLADDFEGYLPDRKKDVWRGTEPFGPDSPFVIEGEDAESAA